MIYVLYHNKQPPTYNSILVSNPATPLRRSNQKLIDQIKSRIVTLYPKHTETEIIGIVRLNEGKCEDYEAQRAARATDS